MASSVLKDSCDPSNPLNLLTTSNSTPKLKLKRKLVDCWDRGQIEKRLEDLKLELHTTNTSATVSRKKRIISRIKQLESSLISGKPVGGQVAKAKKNLKKIRNQSQRETGFAKKSKPLTPKPHKSKLCLRCRKWGHLLPQCPLNEAPPTEFTPQSVNSTSTMASSTKPTRIVGIHGICFNCGSVQHTLKACNKLRSKDGKLPFATCFSCGQTGHLISQCENHTSTGIYPKGGGCRTCGSVHHLQIDCPTFKKEQKAKVQVKQSSGHSGTTAPTNGDPDDYWMNTKTSVRMTDQKKSKSFSKRPSNKFSKKHSGHLKKTVTKKKRI